jgi:hypothetical protein
MISDDELEGNRKEAVMAQSRYHLNICMEELRKTMKHLSQDSPWTVQNSNQTPPEYESTIQLPLVTNF